MSVKRSGLGRGLDALLPKIDKGVHELALDQLTVSPYQPRKRMDAAAIAELAASIAEKGVLQPLLVRPVSTGFEIVAGERRYRAAQQAGLTKVPAVVKELNDQETLEVAIIENLQREDLNAAEEARAFKQLMDFGLNQEQLAKAVGKSRSAIANALRLLKLPAKALLALEEGAISAGHARAILGQPAQDRDWALKQIIVKSLSVREAEKLQRNVAAAKAASPSDRRYLELEADLTRHAGTRVKVLGGSKGRIELHFFSPDELQRLLELLGYQA